MRRHSGLKIRRALVGAYRLNSDSGYHGNEENVAHDLSSLIAAYEALSDKTLLYARGLIRVISEIEVELSADIRRMMGELREKLAGRPDPSVRQESGSSE